MNKKQLLNHVTGLRGIAILGIVLFHACKATFPNGYLGVSVFLCITGYFLFSSFLREDFQFSLTSFVKKRVIRLFPPYIAAIALFLIICAWFIPFDYFETTAKHAIFSLAGLSNIYYKHSLGDYFATDSGSWIFLTTWYFSVLLQVYVFYGVISKIGSYFSKNIRILLLSLCGVLSFCWLFPPSSWLGILDADKSIIADFYFSSLTRLWIVVAGGLAVFLPAFQSERLRNCLYLCSLLGIIYFLFLSHSALASQDIAIVPLSMLCIRYAPTGIIRFIPENIIIQRIGSISFSLYLIHWPVLVLGNYVYEGRTGIWYYTGMTALILLLSAALYKAIEKRSFSLTATISAWCITMAAAVGIMQTHGLYHYLHPTVSALGEKRYENYRPISNDAPIAAHFPQHFIGGIINPPYESPHALYHLGSDKKDPDFILLGDSHALSIAPGVDTVGKEAGWSGVYAQTYVMPFDQCATSSAGVTWNPERQSAILNYLQEHPELRSVVLVQMWSARLGFNYQDWNGKFVDIEKTPEKDYEKTRDFVLKLRNLRKNVIILTDVPFFTPNHSTTGCTKGINFFDVAGYVRKNVLFHRPLDMKRIGISLQEYQADNRIATRVLDKIAAEKLATVIHLEDYLMNDEQFYAYQRGKLLYNDANHLSPNGAIKVVGDIKEELLRALQSAEENKSL